MSYNNLINDRLGAYTITADAANIADANGIDGFLYDGVMDIIENCRKHKPHLLPLFTSTISQSGNTLANNGNMDIMKVTATTSAVVYPARFVGEVEMTRSAISGSLYASTSEDPIWGMIDRQITVLPSSGPSAYGFTRIVPDTVDASGAPNASNPSNFPVDLHYLLAIYATIKVLDHIATNKVNEISTHISTAVTKIGELFTTTLDQPDIVDIQDALTKAQNLIDGTTIGGDSGTAESAQFWLLDEDPDMVSSTISVASQELSRAGSIMTSIDKKTASITKYTDLIAPIFQEIQGLVTMRAVSSAEYMAFFKDPELSRGKGQNAA